MVDKYEIKNSTVGSVALLVARRTNDRGRLRV